MALGDCAVTGNISAMKNLVGTKLLLEKGYFDLADVNKGYYPDKIVPKLLDKVIPLNEAIDVDFLFQVAHHQQMQYIKHLMLY